MKKQLLAGFLSCLLLFSGVKSYAANALDKVSSEYGVPILYEFDYSTYFSDTLLKRNCTLELRANNPELRHGNIDLVSQTIAEFFARYPKELLKQNVRNIFLLSDLHCNNIPYGGTVSEKGIYVEVFSYTDKAWLLDALHHEFSSMLIRRNGFSLYKFSEISGRDKYNTSIEQNCLRFSNCRGNPNTYLYERGFLNKYAMTSYENDVNIYAEYIFVREKELKLLALRYPLIDKKYKYLKDFYEKLGVKF